MHDRKNYGNTPVPCKGSQRVGVAATIAIRLFEERDAEQIAQLFHDTVREINIRDYSSDQVRAWAPDDIYFRNWVEVCSRRFTYVADDMGIIAGFGELEANGHIDCFYCHKNYQGCGVGKQIYRVIEAKAIELSLSRLFVEVSITAKPFFQRMGFLVVRKQEVTCRGETFVNYLMEKSLLIYKEITLKGTVKIPQICNCKIRD